MLIGTGHAMPRSACSAIARTLDAPSPLRNTRALIEIGNTPPIERGRIGSRGALREEAVIIGEPNRHRGKVLGRS